MKRKYWAVPVALISLMAAHDARAQQAPRTITQAAYYNTYRNYYAQPETPASPSDAPAPPAVGSVLAAPAAPPSSPVFDAPPGATAPVGGGFIHESCDPPCVGGCYAGHGRAAHGCGSLFGGHGCGCNGCECAGDDEPWRLFGDVSLFGSDPLFFVGGWIQGGITGNADGNRSGTGNFPVPYNYVSDGFIFNQGPWIYAERLADTGGAGFDWGARVDYVFGTDSKFTNAFGDQGWDYDWQSSRDYGSAIPQLYVDLAYNNWNLRLGHFFTIIGYEVVPAIGNFFYSHALTQNFGEPFTHTGGLVSYRPDDAWTFYGGYVTGWDSGFENRNDAHTFLGGATYAWEDIGSLAWGVNTGDFGDGGAFPGAANGDIYMNSLVGTVNLTDEVRYVIQHDHGVNFDVPAGPGSEWYGICQYLFVTLTDYLQFGARVEWFDDADGARIGSVNPAGPGAEGDYYSYTIGLNVIPSANFRVRPELRWDRFDGTAPAGALPYDNGTEDDLFTAGVDGILQF